MSFLTRALAAAAAAVFISSCHQVTEVPTVGKTTQQPNRDRVIVYVEFVSDIDEISKFCPELEGALYGCARSEQIGPDEWVCRVKVQKPADFNDHPRLAVLGHEAYHCLGAKHT